MSDKMTSEPWKQEIERQAEAAVKRGGPGSCFADDALRLLAEVRRKAAEIDRLREALKTACDGWAWWVGRKC